MATFTEEQVQEVKSAAIDFSVYVSRAEVAVQLAKALNLDTSDITASVFSDVKETDHFTGAANALNKIGVFHGDQEGRFNANSPITRAEMAKVLVTAYNLQMEGQAMTFSDVSTKNWAHDYIQVLASNNITNGIGQGLFGAKDYVSYTQLEIFIDRAKKQQN